MNREDRVNKEEFVLKDDVRNQKDFSTIRHDFDFVLAYFRGHQTQLITVFLLFSCSMIIGLFLPKLMGALVDHATYKKGGFNQIFLFFIALTLSKIFLEVVYKIRFANLGATIVLKMRRDIYQILINLPMYFFDRNSSGKIISRTVSDVNNLATFFNTNFFTIVSDVILIVGSLLMLFTESALLGLAVTIIVSFLFVRMIKINLELGEIFKNIRSYHSRMSSFVADTMNNRSIMSSQNYLPRFRRRFQKLNNLSGKHGRKRLFVWAFFTSAHAICLGLAYSLVVGIGYYKIGQKAMTPGGFIAYLSYLSMIFFPFFDISEKINVVLTAFGSVGKLKEIFRYKALKTNHDTLRDRASKASSIDGDIVFDNVCFSYTDKHLLYENLNVAFQANQITAIIGRTGSGKTTLTNLITGLYQLNAGKIFWGKENFENIHPEDKAKLIGIVTQELFLFEDTIRENLRLYDQAISDSEIWAVIDDLGLHDLINKSPEGLDTKVDSRLDLFSTGEKQLLIIARMLIRNPRLLIFDEASSNLDNESEFRVQNALIKLFKNRTTLIIAHRLSTLSIADKIVVIDSGRVVKTAPFSQEFIANKEYLINEFNEEYKEEND